VTGSGRNIGRATVLKLAGEGAHVVVNARSNQQEAETVAREARDLGVKAVPVLADVGKKAEVEALAARPRSCTPSDGGIAAVRRLPQTFSISSICAPSGAATQHTCRPLLTRSSRICAPFFLKFARAPA
jgi:NAD(P)-dependent dehydrogenase (short-subunit alcohol dehydrogenase family)